MKKFFVVLILLTVWTFGVQAQSDCGNCWVINGGCDPTAICDITGLCQVCLYYVDCDDHNCANGPHWQCVCPWSEAAPTTACLNDQIKHAVLKQKLVNRVAMRTIENKKASEKSMLLLAVRANFLR